MARPVVAAYLAGALLLAGCSDSGGTKTAPDIAMAQAAQTSAPASAAAPSAPATTRPYEFFNFGNLPPAISLVFGAGDASDPDWDAYLRDLDRAYFELRYGDPAAAAALFAKAEAKSFPEQENIAAWGGSAAALCRSGKLAEGAAKLADFQCAKDLIAQKTTCTVLEARQARGDAVAPGCLAEMCGQQIVRTYYDGYDSKPNPSYMAMLQDYIDETAKTCQATPR